MTEQQKEEKISFILDIMDEKRPLLKQQFTREYSRRGTEKDKDKYPEYTPIYARTCELAEKIRPHSEDDYFPERMFFRKAPNEKPEEFEYRKQIFREIGGVTYPYWEKALNTIGRIWNEKNYTIKYPEISDAVLEKYPAQEYFEKQYPDYVAIEDQFKSVITPDKFSDPNSWSVLDIQEPIIQNEPLNPYARIYQADQLIGFHNKEWVLFLTTEKSVVEFNGKKDRSGLVLRYYDRECIFQVRQIGKKIDFTFEAIEIYVHDLGELYADRLKGRPKREKEDIYFESYFMPAIASLNEVILDASNLQISKIVSAFPERWEYVDDCDAEGCEGGKVFTNSEDRSIWRNCLSCQGTGRRNFSSPLSVMEVKAPKEGAPLQIQSDKLTMPPAGYIAKQAEVTPMLQFLREEIRESAVISFQMLNIDVSNAYVKGSDTALGKQIDREELFSFLLNVSTELFSLMEFMINGIGRLRYGNAWKPVQIGYPQNFAVRSDSELTEELKTAREANLPSTVLYALTTEYTGKRFNSQADMERLNEFIYKVDRLAVMSSIDIAQRLSTQTIAKWEAILHDSINYFIEQAVIEDPNFWQKDFEEQEKIIVEMAKEQEKQISTPKIDPEEIIAQTDIRKAEAALNLRSTVGGVQSLLKVVENVNLGLISREAAIANIIELFGVDEETAVGMVGSLVNTKEPVAE